MSVSFYRELKRLCDTFRAKCQQEFDVEASKPVPNLKKLVTIAANADAGVNHLGLVKCIGIEYGCHIFQIRVGVKYEFMTFSHTVEMMNDWAERADNYFNYDIDDTGYVFRVTILPRPNE